IFMGDTGSLALGGLLVGLAITTRTQLLLLVIGGLFVLITASVIIQVGSFRLTGKRSEEHTSELQSRENLVCRLLLEKKKYRLCSHFRVGDSSPMHYLLTAGRGGRHGRAEIHRGEGRARAQPQVH